MRSEEAICERVPNRDPRRRGWGAGLFNSVEKATLLLAVIGATVVWLLPFLLARFGAEWIRGWYSYSVYGPVAVVGVLALRHYGGFAKSLPVVCLAVLMLAGVAWTDSTERQSGLTYALNFLVTIPIAALIRKHDWVTTVFRVVVVATAVLMVYTFAQPAASGRWGNAYGAEGPKLDRFGTVRIGNPDQAGMMCAASTLFLLMTFRRRERSRLKKWLPMVAIPVLLFGCVQTASRASIIALVGSLGVALWMRARRNVAAVIPMLFLALVGVATLIVLDQGQSGQRFLDRALERFTDADVGTLGGRTDIWMLAYDEFTQGLNPLYGVGTGGVEKALGRFSGQPNRTFYSGIWHVYPHNTIVWLGLALGCPGLALGLWLSVKVVRRAYRLDKRNNDWRRFSYLSLLILIGNACAINLEPGAIILIALLWVLVSVEPAQAPDPGNICVGRVPSHVARNHAVLSPSG